MNTKYGGYSEHELRVYIHQERQRLITERCDLVTLVTKSQQRIDEIDARLAKLDEADDLLEQP